MNPIIEKIKKILAIADDQAGTPEGEAAARMAARYMAAHAVSMADVQASELGEDEVGEHHVEVAATRWKRTLMRVLAEHCSCRCFYLTNSKRFVLVGYRTDAEVARYLFDVCALQVDDAASEWKRKGGHKGVYRRDGRPMGTREALFTYRMSVVLGLARKLEEIRADVAGENPNGTALVLRRLDDADRYMKENVTNLRKRNKRQTVLEEGIEAGRKINLQQGVGGSARPQIG